MPDALKTPVAFIIFNRPKCTRRVFAEIRKARPEKLYLIADGARPHKAGEAEECAETRSIVENMIDWSCKVNKDYAEQNMGCGKRIISGLNWVFENEEQAIILEDDILVHPSFFVFCEALLDRYRNVDQVMQISGYNLFGYCPKGCNYFYSRYANIWGWATWRRAWNTMKGINQNTWDCIKQRKTMRSYCLSPIETQLREAALERIFTAEMNNWDAKWALARNMCQGMGVVPSRNLAKNIGFSIHSTHTINPFNRHRFARIESTSPPFIAPSNVIPDEKYDRLYNRRMYSQYVRCRTAIWNLMYARRHQN